ncbi:MAG: hypothetical protein SGILL_001524 [Bacillariaceae sp.]
MVLIGKAVFGRPGIYDVILEMKGIPFLDSHPPSSITMRGIKAQDIMSSSPLIMLVPEQNVGEMIEFLKKYRYISDFPIIDPQRNGIFMGVVTRQDLCTILMHREIFYEPGSYSDDVEEETKDEDELEQDKVEVFGLSEAKSLKKIAPRRRALKFEELVHNGSSEPPDIDCATKVVTEYDFGKVVDLTPYMEIGHYTINQHVSVERTFELFRTLGLRDLIVTDAYGRPVGVVTRYDLKLLEEVGVDENHLSRKRKNVGVYSHS